MAWWHCPALGPTGSGQALSLSLPSQPPLLCSMASVHVPCARKGSVATSAWLHLPTPGPLPLAHFAPLLKTFLQICLMDTYFLALKSTFMKALEHLVPTLRLFKTAFCSLIHFESSQSYFTLYVALPTAGPWTIGLSWNLTVQGQSGVGDCISHARCPTGHPLSPRTTSW